MAALDALFQSTRPVRGATHVAGLFSTPTTVSIHAPRAGRDQHFRLMVLLSRCFNPRAPCGARHSAHKSPSPFSQFQSTRPVRGATFSRHDFCATEEVSIHAPRAGRDCRLGMRRAFSVGFNPRAPCGARLCSD